MIKDDLQPVGAMADENLIGLYDDKLYRFVPKNPKDARWKLTWEFLQTDLFKQLQELRYVPQYDLIGENEEHFIYEVEQIPHLIRPSEFINQQSFAVIALSCRINKLLDDSCWELTEGHLWNFAFLHTDPILLDIGAIDHLPHRRIFSSTCLQMNVKNFCQTPNVEQFVKDWPSIPALEDWDRAAEFFENESIQHDQNEWDAYNKYVPNNPSDIIPNNIEQERIMTWFKLTKPKDLIDVGGNDGLFARLATTVGINAVCIDNAANALTCGYLYARQHKLPITYANINLTAAIPESADNSLHLDANWPQRLRCDFAFFSSITHHLIKAGMSLEQQAKLASTLAERYLAIELIRHNDPTISGWYGPEVNVEELTKNLPDWNLLDQFSNYEPGLSIAYRTWLLYERINPESISLTSA